MSVEMLPSGSKNAAPMSSKRTCPSGVGTSAALRTLTARTIARRGGRARPVSAGCPGPALWRRGIGHGWRLTQAATPSATLSGPHWNTSSQRLLTPIFSTTSSGVRPSSAPSAMRHRMFCVRSPPMPRLAAPSGAKRASHSAWPSPPQPWVIESPRKTTRGFVAGRLGERVAIRARRRGRPATRWAAAGRVRRHKGFFLPP